MSLEICNLLARNIVIETNDSRIPGSSEQLSARTERYRADRLDEARETVQETRSVVAEDIDIPALMAGGSEAAIRALE